MGGGVGFSTARAVRRVFDCRGKSKESICQRLPRERRVASNSPLATNQRGEKRRTKNKTAGDTANGSCRGGTRFAPSPAVFLFNMKKTKRTQTAKSKTAGTLQRQSAEPKFRSPVRSEIVAAVASIRSCFFDRESRDFDFDDYWEEHCLQFLLKEYLQKTN
jgi:hypothetical protein